MTVTQPPMGRSSLNTFGFEISEKLLLNVADFIEKSDCAKSVEM